MKDFHLIQALRILVGESGNSETQFEQLETLYRLASSFRPLPLPT